MWRNRFDAGMSEHAKLVSFRIGHHHMVGRAIQRLLPDHRCTRRGEPGDPIGHPGPAGVPRFMAASADMHGLP
jgi:hypothetical protein